MRCERRRDLNESAPEVGFAARQPDLMLSAMTIADLAKKMHCGKCGNRDVAYKAWRQEDAPGRRAWICEKVLIARLGGVEFLVMPNPPPSLRPMADFDPSEPAILHDSRTDCIVTWTGEDVATYREEAIARPDGTVEWSGYIFDGWGNVLGG